MHVLNILWPSRASHAVRIAKWSDRLLWNVINLKYLNKLKLYFGSKDVQNLNFSNKMSQDQNKSSEEKSYLTTQI